MDIPVPVTCTNPFCRLSFFLSGFLNLSGNSSVTMRGCGTKGPCPRCGSTVTIADGVYRSVPLGGATVLLNDLSVLERAVDFLRVQQQKDQPTAITKQQANTEIPELSCLWDLLPKKRSEAYTVIGILITVLLFIITQCRQSPKDPPKLTGVPSEIIDALLKPQPASPPDNHTDHSSKKRRKKDRRK